MIRHNGYVFTGGPGAGKTSVITALAAKGFAVIPESGRQIIQEQVASGGAALPWANKELFRDRMLAAALRDFEQQPIDGRPVFFDRGIPDLIGYSALENLPVPAVLQTSATTLRYHPRVFIFPPWKEIYQGDTERKQDYATAVATYEAMQTAYTAHGYKLVTVPFGSVADRVAFILDNL
ncbi:AAA family ATPase [Chitinophaga varians]|uniref:AAA family ATPase n=1 Tax=Chitinophaga varians TaxID=2202339 RepID=UPI00165FEC65|nr:AAA family ATPase [Chitinophaga varians]MBC9915110.1 AAA family ATPase [Chitinophaga varians]